MKLRSMVWSSVVVVQVMTGCGRHDDARHTVMDDAAGRQPAQAQQHEHAAAHTSNGVEAPVGDARRLSRMERVARTLEDFSASLGLQAKSFTLHPELQLAACSNVFDLLPDDEFKQKIADFYAARRGAPSADELHALREIIERRIRKNIRSCTPGEYGRLLTMKLQTYYRDRPTQDYAGFIGDTLAALALVRDTYEGAPQLNDFVVETLVASGGAYPMLQYFAMRRGGVVEQDMVQVIDTEIALNPYLSAAQRAQLTDVKYHCLVITEPDRVIEEGRRFLAGVPAENHFSLAMFVEGLEKGLRGEELARCRAERIRTALRKER